MLTISDNKFWGMCLVWTLSLNLYAQKPAEKPDIDSVMHFDFNDSLLTFDEHKILQSSNPIISDTTSLSTDLVPTAKQQPLYVEFETKVLFSSGHSHLSDKDRRRLNLLANELIDDVKYYKSLYPSDSLVVVLGVVGYTDAVPFHTNQHEQHRQNQNLHLSKMRAKSTSHYLKKALGHNLAYRVENYSDGQGEELPHFINQDPTIDDPQRRSCVVHVLIYNELPQDLNAQLSANDK
jgi:outer membrane protein OmpA-like peptidoglycan-associated protein